MKHWLKHKWKTKTVVTNDMEVPCECYWLKRIYFLIVRK